ncbi:MAG: hypothetical protein NTU63_02770 [Candidatus Pacearchaeota archaeon]|nr:hypothetical protein [Candidatus Pacearchaeota archaeon]
MGVLEQVTKMKNQGYRDDEIISELHQQGVPPREINDALKQVQIKYAVSDVEDMEKMRPSIIRPGEEEDLAAPTSQISTAYKSKTREMSEVPKEEVYVPQPQEQYAPSQYASPSQAPQEAYPSDVYSEYPAYGGFDTDTIIEISDQIFTEKIKKIQRQVDLTTEITTLLETKMDNISERLNRIETIIDKLQFAILEKVGSYGQNLEGIKKEMSMMQDSFSKMVNPIMEFEKNRNLNETTSETSSDNTTPQRRIYKKK